MGEQLNIFLFLRFTLGVSYCQVTVSDRDGCTRSDVIGEFTSVAAELSEAGGHAESNCSCP